MPDVVEVPLSPEELADLWSDFVVTRDPRIREQLLIRYMPLVPYVVRRISLPDWVDRDDFISYGYLGLIDAIDKFRPEMGNQFQTYATKRIRGAVLDGQRVEDPLTRNARKQVRAVHEVTVQSWQINGRPATAVELQAATGLTTETISHLIGLRQTWNASLDDTDTAQDDEQVYETLTDVRSDDPELAAQMAELKQVIADGLADLSRRERTFVALYYGSGMTLKEVGERLGVSDARVGQIRLAVINALRSSM